MRARLNNQQAFPSPDIPSLVEIAIQVVAENFEEHKALKGVSDPNVLKGIVKLIDTELPITVTAQNVDFEFYWQKKCEPCKKDCTDCLFNKCKKLKNCKKEDHGGSVKQAFIERRI